MIRLRVAGIYYDELFDLAALAPIPPFAIPDQTPPVGGVPTIFDLLEAARRRPGLNKLNFSYVFERRGSGLALTSIGVTHTKSILNTLGSKQRPAGSYHLTEIAIPFGVVAWQSYVYRNGKSASQFDPASGSGYSPANAPGSTFTFFDQFQLIDGDEVIWRQVAILREPNVPA